MTNLISRNDLVIMRNLRDCINKEFGTDFKVSDQDFIKNICPYVLDSVNERLYDDFCKLESIVENKQPEKKKARKMYRGRPVD